eukprot:scaffold264_cov317-Pinguiococcus_pyrenoidosus.AAC.8
MDRPQRPSTSSAFCTSFSGTRREEMLTPKQPPTQRDVDKRFLLHLHVLPPTKGLAVTKHPPGSVILYRPLSGSVRTEKLIKGVGDALRVAVSNTLDSDPEDSGGDACLPLVTSYGGAWRSLDCEGEANALVLELVLLPPNYEGTVDDFPRRPREDAEPFSMDLPGEIGLLFCSEDEKLQINQKLDALHREQKLAKPAQRPGRAREPSRGAGTPPLPSLDAIRDSIGGLDDQLSEIYRRVVLPRAMTHQLRSMLGIQPVKGLLLYGPPGCGKTALARSLTAALQASSLQIVNGPELLSKWTGESEQRMRNLFRVEEQEGYALVMRVEALRRSRKKSRTKANHRRLPTVSPGCMSSSLMRLMPSRPGVGSSKTEVPGTA